MLFPSKQFGGIIKISNREHDLADKIKNIKEFLNKIEKIITSDTDNEQSILETDMQDDIISLLKGEKEGIKLSTFKAICKVPGDDRFDIEV